MIPDNISGITEFVKRVHVRYFEALISIFSNLTSSKKVTYEKVYKILG
jgi:hypothetical protein